MPVVVMLAILCAVLGLASLVLLPLSLFVLVGTLVVGLLLPAGPHRRTGLLFVGIATLCASVGFVRFVVVVAVPGIIEAGQKAQTKQAIYRLRDIHLAEDAMRSTGFWDPDGDGIGSAGDLAELTASSPFRGVRALAVPALNPRFGKLERGAHGDVATVDGYCFVVFVPDDDELAERRFVAYAWPALGSPRGDAVFLDEHERIYVSRIEGVPGARRYEGPARMPTFDAALSIPTWSANPHDGGGVGVDGHLWTRWKDKRPQGALKGDRASSSNEATGAP